MNDLLGLVVVLARNADADRDQRPKFRKFWKTLKRTIGDAVELVDDYIASWVDDAQASTATPATPRTIEDVN